MEDMIVKGRTSSGFEFAVDKRKVNDRRVMRHMVAAASESTTPMEKLDATLKYQELILGEKQTEELEAHICELNEGICPSEVFNDEMLEIINACKEIKN